MGERYTELFRAVQPAIYTWMAANMEKLIFGQVETANLVLAALEPHGKGKLHIVLMIVFPDILEYIVL